MEITLPAEPLIDVVQKILPICDKRQSLAILNCLKFEVENGIARITGTDMEMYIISELCNAEGTGLFVVSARKIYEIIKYSEDLSEVKIILDNSRLRINVNSSTFNILTYSIDEYPVFESFSGNVVAEIEQEELKYLISKSMFAIANNDHRLYLNGLLLDFSNNYIQSVATDGHRLAISRMSYNTNANTKVIIPKKAVYELHKLLSSNSPVKIIIGDNFINFETNEFKFVTKLIDSRYPEYRNIIPSGKEKQLLFEKDKLKSIIQRTSVIAKDKLQLIDISVKNDKVCFYIKNSDGEEAEDSIPINQNTGYDFTVSFNLNYVLNILDNIESTSLSFNFIGETNIIKYEEIVLSKYELLYILMPIKL